MSDVKTTVREVLETHGRMPVSPSTLGDDDDLYDNGLSSHASVNVMLALEDAFDVEFPDALLRKGTFQTISAISEALASMGVVDPPS
ncbi:MAG: acyl carrier protein [Acidimicrobiales bacterium]|jgi:acyl carrier protein